MLLVLIYIAMWRFIPDFGETVLWQDGAINYLWGTCIVLLFMLPYRMYLSDDRLFCKKRWLPIMAALGFLGGACNENTSGAACLAVGIFFIWCLAGHRKIPAWAILGLVFSVLGFLFMTMAPANQIRTQYIISNTGDSFMHVDSLRDLVHKAIWIVRRIWDLIGPWFLYLTVFLITYFVFRDRTIKPVLVPCTYVLCMAAAMGAMIIPPVYADRAEFGPVIFWLIGIAGLLSRLQVKRDLPLTMALLTCLLLLTGREYVASLEENLQLHEQVSERIAYVQEQKEQGNLDLTFRKIVNPGQHSGWIDMAKSPEEAIYYYNVHFAEYYGLNSVILEDIPDYMLDES